MTTRHGIQETIPTTSLKGVHVQRRTHMSLSLTSTSIHCYAQLFTTHRHRHHVVLEHQIRSFLVERRVFLLGELLPKEA